MVPELVIQQTMLGTAVCFAGMMIQGIILKILEVRRAAKENNSQ